MNYFPIDDLFEQNKSKKHRDAVREVIKFIEGDKCFDGNILVLYGLRRTGKTTIMSQALEQYKNPEKCAFYELEEQDDIDSVKKILIEAKRKGISVICFDEITNAKDFATNSAALADIFAKQGIRIIVTGTDSLGFQFADNDELYDRTIRINTTHIPFSEHCRVLGTNDMDDYIQFGGLMRKGEPEDRVVYDYLSARKYLDRAVAENISRSIKYSSEDSCLEVLSKEELTAIISKMVELYSGSFNKKEIQNELKNVSVNYPIKKLGNIKFSDEEIIDRLVLEKKNITKDFSHVINADVSISKTITNEMIQALEKYLIDMNLLSATREVQFRYNDEFGWQEGDTKHEFYIVQPALKYHHLQKGKEFIEKEQYYKDLSSADKEYMQKKLDEKIKGEMTEQIVVFDVSRDLPKSRYFVCKPVFFIDGQRKGEYDMLIYDKVQNKYWGFEIKHTTNPFPDQDKHLQNELFKEVIDAKFGDRENVCVLYRGDPFSGGPLGPTYLNITDFMLAVEKYQDIDLVFAELTKDLPVRDIYNIENSHKSLDEKIQNVSFNREENTNSGVLKNVQNIPKNFHEH